MALSSSVPAHQKRRSNQKPLTTLKTSGPSRLRRAPPGTSALLRPVRVPFLTAGMNAVRASSCRHPRTGRWLHLSPRGRCRSGTQCFQAPPPSPGNSQGSHRKRLSSARGRRDLSGKFRDPFGDAGSKTGELRPSATPSTGARVVCETAVTWATTVALRAVKLESRILPGATKSGIIRFCYDVATH